MPKVSSALLLLLAGCPVATTPPSKLATVARIASTLDVDCIPDDEIDDRECVQRKVDAACAEGGGTIQFAAGVYRFSQDPILGTRYNAGIRVECSGIRLIGAGASTVLMMSGDGDMTTWHLVKVIANPDTGVPVTNFEIADMALSSSDAINVEEQTHLITLSGLYGPVSGVSIHNLWLRNVVRPEVAGDCIRMLGEATGPIRFVDVADVVLEECDRSGIAIQRAVSDVTIHDSLFQNVGKTPIDFEPTGPGAVEKFAIRGNVIEGKGVSLAGQGDAALPTTDLVFAGNVMRGGSVGIFNMRRLVVADNTVESVVADEQGVIAVRASEDVLVTGNTARRLSGSVAGPVIKVNGSNGKFATRVVLSGNLVTDEVAGNPIELESAQDVTASGNDITSGPGGAYSGIYAKASGRDLDRLQLTGNRIKGPLQYAIKIAGSPFFVGAVQVRDNMSSGPTLAGLRCENPVKFLKPVVHGGYYYDGATTAASGCTSVAQERP